MNVSVVDDIPAPLRPAWADIERCEEQLDEALAAGEYERLGALSNERHACILRFFDAFAPQPSTAPLRLALLEELNRRNDALLAASRARIGEVAKSAAHARSSRRAVNAYQRQDDAYR